MSRIPERVPRLLLLLLAVLVPAGADAQSRRNRTTPGLVLETGARHATCDALIFVDDGKTLLAAGDDKVVRSWPVLEASFDRANRRVLRWPVFRERRGCIHALAVSPDSKRVVVGGLGVKNGYLAILDRETGKLVQGLENIPSAQAVWAVTFSPDGRKVVYGVEDGAIYLWDLDADARKAPAAIRAGERKLNRLRLVTFLDRDSLLAVAQDGEIWKWDISRAGDRGRKLGQLRLPNAYRVVLGPDGKWLAAIGEQSAGGRSADVQRVELYSLADGDRQFLTLPEPKPGERPFPRCIAFDERGQRLAVGLRILPVQQQVPVEKRFYKEIGGRILVYDLSNRRVSVTLELDYPPEALAFRPGRKNQLANAGGNNHEVRLWDLDKPAAPVADIRGPGNCLWGVGLSKDGRYLGFQETRASNPDSPNQWGAGDWRVFDLRERRLLPRTPEDFKPIRPKETAGGWKVQFTPDANVWNVVSPEGKVYPLDQKSGLYDPRTNNVPRCYSFLDAGDGKPVRLLVGHIFGVSLYELNRDGPRLARVMVGHEDEVMALAPSADQKTLVTASRDMTISIWSLADFPRPLHPELGASFKLERGKLIVDRVEPGSPAWEAGLSGEDEIVMLVVVSEKFYYDPDNRGLSRYGFVLPGGQKGDGERALELLRKAQPNRELIFVWKRDGKEMPPQLTTVRQRPVFRFFATRAEFGNDWILWRWRDFYYDTNSPLADAYVGWHVNGEKLSETPVFYRLEQLRERLHNPQKVGKLEDVERFFFADVEPPWVKVTAPARVKGEDLVLKLQAKPRGEGKEQKLARVQVWLDDYRMPKPPEMKNGEVDEARFIIPQDKLKLGVNRIRLQAFNAAESRGEDGVTVVYEGAERPKPTLHALCVGITDYRRTVPPRVNVRCARADAEALAALWQTQKGKFYGTVDVEVIPQERATAEEVLRRLRILGGKVKPDDWLIFFLAGHGEARRLGGAHVPGSYFFVCVDTDLGQPGSKLDARRLHETLAGIRCNKLILLDTCRSGDVASHPIRDLSRDGVSSLIFSACRPDESSVEPKDDREGKHSYFVQSVTEAGGGSFARADINGDGVLDAAELAAYIKSRVPALVKPLGRTQTPVIYEEPVLPLRLLSRP